MNSSEQIVKIATTDDDWREQCWDAAQRGRPFTVEVLNDGQYRTFFNALCYEFSYSFTVDDDGIHFNPE